MYCKNCGESISDNAKSCPKCGEPFVEKSTYSAKERHINKHVFVWVGAFLFGGIGVDRFMRGQVGIGIVKLLTCGVFGILSLIDWIVAMCESYSSNHFGEEEDVVFINGKYGR